MGYGVAWINIQIIVQTIFEMPWYYDTKTESLIVNAKRRYKFIHRLYKMPTWIIVSLIGLFTFVMCVIHLINIVFRINAGENVPVLETLFYCATCTSTFFGLATIYSVENDIFRRYSTIDTISAIFVEGNIRHIGVPTTERLPDIPELIGYGIMGILLSVPLIAATWPLVLDVDPINRDLKGKLPEIPRRLLASLIYGWVTYIAGNACGLFLLLILSCCNIFEKHTEKNFHISHGYIHNNQPSMLETTAQQLSKHFLRIVEWIYPKWKTFNTSNVAKTHTRSNYRVLRNQLNNFAARKHDHNTMLLLMASSNSTIAVFLPTLAAQGIILCTVLNFGRIYFYDREDLRIIWGAVVVINICAYYFIMFFCHHAAKPLIFTEETIRYWKGRLVEKIERRQVRAMMSYGFTLGQFFKVRSITAFNIVDTILSQTVSFLLASKS